MFEVRWRHALFGVGIIVLTAGTLLAEPPQADPPGRVARLNYVSGQVSFRPADLDDWGVAALNYPLTVGDHLWTDTGAYAEMHLGATAIRLAPETAFAFLNLDDDVVQARVAEGSIDVRVREFDENDVYEIGTPNGSISLASAGVYRVDVDPEGTRTRITVRAGQAVVSGDGASFPVYPGQSAEIRGTEDFSYDVDRAAQPDAWEQWCRSRDRREDSRPSLSYVSRDMVGWEDLDDYGTWNYVPEYGWAWRPAVVAIDWAPYRYGHWASVGPWGWTWIDDAPWGFAPFHYGRWAFYRSHWIWVPGRMVRRPVFAPALVAFVGGPNWSFSFSFGIRPAVGWFPLAPGEVYYPAYHVSQVYVRNVNVTHVNVTNITVTNVNVTSVHYRNRDVVGAVTAVPRDLFVASQSVGRSGVAVPRRDVERTRVEGHGAGVAPGPRSELGHVPAAAPRPSDSAMRRPVVVRHEPPAAARRAEPVVSLGSLERRHTGAAPDSRGEVGAIPARNDDRTNPSRDARDRPQANDRNASASRPATNPPSRGTDQGAVRRDEPPRNAQPDRSGDTSAGRGQQSQPDRTRDLTPVRPGERGASNGRPARTESQPPAAADAKQAPERGRSSTQNAGQRAGERTQPAGRGAQQAASPAKEPAKAPAKASDKAQDKSPAKAPAKASDKAQDKGPAKAPAKASDKAQEKGSDKAPAKASDKAQEKGSDKAPAKANPKTGRGRGGNPGGAVDEQAPRRK